jgi:exopolyphosphatase/guanosine-5'-triphosphate,3'-diphosphate pyrophosphatase
VLHQGQTITRLGEGLAKRGMFLSGEAIDRTALAVLAHCRDAERLGAVEVLVVGTSAVRDANNRRDLLERIRENTGLNVNVVTGEEEARLTFLGAYYGLGQPGGRWLIMDIGGGSTEFVLAEGAAIHRAVSVRLGVVALTETYATADPVDWADYATLTAAVESVLAREIPPVFFDREVKGLIGTAGTVTTLAALDQRLEAYEPNLVQGYRLHRHRIEQLLVSLGVLRFHDRVRLPCLEPGRADVIIAGTSICLVTLKLFGWDTITVSDWGLREGILVDHCLRELPR